MRILFVLLLLANAGFFAWQYQARGGFTDRAPSLESFQPTDPGVTPLTLLSERASPSSTVLAPTAEAETLPLGGERTSLPEAAEIAASDESTASEQVIAAAPAAEPEPMPAPAPEAEPAMKTAPVVTRRCHELGPSADRAAIDQAAATARQTGARTSIRESAQTGTDGYWVRLPDYYSYSEARARYRELQQMGVDDIAIVPLPDKRYFISLGVYKRKDTVEERRNEILAKGVTPLIEDRTHAATLYTLAFEYESADPAPLQRLLAELAPRIALREVACQ